MNNLQILVSIIIICTLTIGTAILIARVETKYRQRSADKFDAEFKRLINNR